MNCACTQVFAQPIFETLEGWVASGKHRLTDRPAVTRVIVRCSYVALTCFLAILIPFFGDLMGCAALAYLSNSTSQSASNTCTFACLALRSDCYQ